MGRSFFFLGDTFEKTVTPTPKNDTEPKKRHRNLYFSYFTLLKLLKTFSTVIYR